MGERCNTARQACGLMIVSIARLTQMPTKIGDAIFRRSEDRARENDRKIAQEKIAQEKISEDRKIAQEGPPSPQA